MRKTGQAKYANLSPKTPLHAFYLQLCVGSLLVCADLITPHQSFFQIKLMPEVAMR
jgi:hypothetical protein